MAHHQTQALNSALGTPSRHLRYHEWREGRTLKMKKTTIAQMEILQSTRKRIITPKGGAQTSKSGLRGYNRKTAKQTFRKEEW
jgi:hypothetical protein